MQENTIQLTLLGTGTSQGVPVIGCTCPVCTSTDKKDKRLRTSALLTIGDLNIGIDIGPDFRQQMLRENIMHLEAILLTHAHNDHIAGMDDVRPFNFKYDRNMPIYATKDVQDNVRQRFPYIFDRNPYPGAPRLELHTISHTESFTIKGHIITPIRVWHGQLPVLGFRIGDVTYLTDIKTIDPEELDKVRGTQVLVLGALHYSKHYSHLNFEEAIALANEIQAEKTYFIHMSHRVGPYAEVAADMPENIELGYDGLKIEVPYSQMIEK